MSCFRILVIVAIAALSAACAAPAAPAAAPPAAKPAEQPLKPAAAAPAPAEPAQTKPAEQPAPAKPAEQPAKPAAGQKLRIVGGATAIGTAFYVYSVAAGKLWNAKVPEVEVTIAESGGCFDNIKRMDKGEFLLTPVACPDLTYRAWHGLEEFKDQPVRTQRYLYGHTLTPQALVVRRDSNITRLEELEGKDWTAGQKGSATEKQILNVMAVLGIKPKYYVAGAQDMFQATRDRRSVGFTRAQAGQRAMDGGTQEVHVQVPLRMLSFTPEQEKIVREKFPYYGFMTVEKDQLAQGFPDRPVRTITLPIGVAAHKDLSEEIAYKLTKVGIEDNMPNGEGIQAAGFPAVKGADFAQLTLDIVLTPLHAGAARYFKEIGKQLKPEQAPVP